MGIHEQITNNCKFTAMVQVISKAELLWWVILRQIRKRNRDNLGTIFHMCP